MFWLVALAGVFPRADVLIEKHMATHCGVLLTSRVTRTDRDEFARLALAARSGMEPAADAHRLEELLADLARPAEVPAVTFVRRGEERIVAFLTELADRTAPLDRGVRRVTRARHLDPARVAREVGAAAAWLACGGATTLSGLDPLAAAPLESAAIVAAVFVARRTIGRAADALMPARRLDLDRVRVDSHLRVIAAEAEAHRTIPTAHLGLTVPISRELRKALLSTRGISDLTPRHLARLLAPPPDDDADQALVDHLTVATEDGPRLLSAVRLRRGEVAAATKRREPARGSTPSFGAVLEPGFRSGFAFGPAAGAGCLF